ncbi:MULTISPECIES: ATP-independent periplasmic protein-refolding chaperone Spy [Rahnella]|jgi:protein CpxP|uniref:ATP-independent periplasmic protein-refolding chaperone n=1 Tax=Rahnella variigena TaxID=574964 RepID=A0ABX9PVI4_9GAMM|nr:MULTISPECIES: ATP-independent periplasmic protein-refolding chaperone Spy [Rahnella]MDH2896596.1 ATP-independent periplasmic protein-refolding chaperone Spy [Rahnella variigena]RJT54757.1 ATP-independent periplasmic protein-refolding chaperone [Rahnella variigena]RKF69091.1 ATP-independent periplasmic protein-refolding chaperone [Rahnella variigena]RYJ17735.1 ATP-independent periplasmic protein-refolding chaperone [Rahnella variigena]TCQ93366.1 Spy/CpxP family protein refolding chaperone [R
MRKLTAMIVASTLALSSASFAFAAETTAAPATDATTAPHGKMMHHKGPHHMNPFAGLNLTEQQKTQMKEIMKDSGPRPDRAAMKAQMDQMHSLVASDSFDESKVKSQIDTITKAQSDRMLERARAENKMYNLLTPEQKKQFNENYQKRAAKMEQMRDHKPGEAKPAAAE